MATELNLDYDPEMRALRESTLDLIKSRPHEIALIRKGEFERTASGGQKRAGVTTTLPAVKRYFGGVSGNPLVIENQTGRQVTASYVLVGDWNDDIREHDEFELFGKRYMVVSVDDASRGYQTKAWVVQE